MAEKSQYEPENWQAEYKKTKDQPKADKNYIDAKLRNAAKREEYRLAQETFFDKILNKLFKSRDKANTPAKPERTR